MSTLRFFSNPDYVEYVHLLNDLHAMIREGRDETDEGDLLRDRMDVPGGRLWGKEVESVKGISADFYTLTDPPPAVLLRTPGVDAELRAALEARDRGDFDAALCLLRKNAPFIAPSQLASLRGSVWDAAGESPIALLFFRRAAELEAASVGHALLASNKD